MANTHTCLNGDVERYKKRIAELEASEAELNELKADYEKMAAENKELTDENN